MIKTLLKRYFLINTNVFQIDYVSGDIEVGTKIRMKFTDGLLSIHGKGYMNICDPILEMTITSITDDIVFDNWFRLNEKVHSMSEAVIKSKLMDKCNEIISSLQNQSSNLRRLCLLKGIVLKFGRHYYEIMKPHLPPEVGQDLVAELCFAGKNDETATRIKTMTITSLTPEIVFEKYTKLDDVFFADNIDEASILINQQ